MKVIPINRVPTCKLVDVGSFMVFEFANAFYVKPSYNPRQTDISCNAGNIIVVSLSDGDLRTMSPSHQVTSHGSMEDYELVPTEYASRV